MQIAVLGWGSLIPKPEPLRIVGGWDPDGPNLPIEFARVSGIRNRLRYLSLVITPGFQEVQTLYAISAYGSLPEACENLREREGTTIANIGFLNFDTSERRMAQAHLSIVEELKRWNSRKHFDAVIWTDLVSNFSSEVGVELTSANVQHYLRSFTAEEFAKSKNYVITTPVQTTTSFRRELENFFTSANQ